MKKSIVFFLVVVSLILTQCGSDDQPMSYRTVKLVETTMWCNKANDGFGPFGNKDNIYCLMAAKKFKPKKGWIFSSDKEYTFQGRFPYGSTWSFTDHGGGPNGQAMQDVYGPFIPWSDTLAIGESVEIACIFMEEDKGTEAERAQALAKILDMISFSDERVAVAAEALNLVGVLLSRNQDDFIGGMNYRIENKNDTIVVTPLSGQNAAKIGTDPNGERFDFNDPEDGFQYFTTWKVIAGESQLYPKESDGR